jgi:hypothetical protein
MGLKFWVFFRILEPLAPPVRQNVSADAQVVVFDDKPAVSGEMVPNGSFAGFL